MEEVFQFITLIVTSHLLIGCSIVAVIGQLLRFLSLNASTRHNIWLGLLVMLLLMPWLTFLSPEVLDQPLSVQTLQILPTPAAATNDPTLAVEISQAAEQINLQPGITLTGRDTAPVLLTASNYSLLKKWTAAALRAIPLYGLGVAFTLIIGFGIALKLLLFIRSYGNLRELFAKSESVNEDWKAVVARLAAQTDDCNCPAVKHSTEVNTPSTSGVLNPWIILPTALLEGKKSPQSMEQILLHELAHIKRRDPLVASLQALVSIFMFWHPAVYYVNKQIRFERELACDDWVINHSERDDTARVKSYASSLLEIAESLQRKVSIVHSVACVHTSHGLVRRINIMLDRNVDHSTSVKPMPGALVTFSVLALLVASTPSWPQLPRVFAQKTEQESVPDYVVSDALTGLSQETQLFTEVGKLLAEPLDLQQVKIEDSQKTIEVSNFPAASESPQHANTEDSQVLSEIRNLLVEAPQRRQAKTAGLVPQLVEKISVAKELETTGVSADTVIALVESELGNSVDELRTELLNDDFTKLNLNSVARVNDSEIVISNMAEISLNTGEPVNEFSDALGRQKQDVVLAGEQLRFEEATLQASVDSDKFIIIDELSRAELRKEIVKVQNEFYRVFNDSAVEERLKISCERRDSKGSFIRRRVCEPRFVIDARNENVANWFRQIGAMQTSVGLKVDLKPEFERLVEAMNVEIRENRYLLDLNKVIRMLRARFDELA